MNSINALKRLGMVVVFGAAVAFVGCGGVTEEQYAQLDALKKEVASLEKQASSLKDERARLEKEIADKTKKLEECAKLKQETSSNLNKIGQ